MANLYTNQTLDSAGGSRLYPAKVDVGGVRRCAFHAKIVAGTPAPETDAKIVLTLSSSIYSLSASNAKIQNVEPVFVKVFDLAKITDGLTIIFGENEDIFESTGRYIYGNFSVDGLGEDVDVTIDIQPVENTVAISEDILPNPSGASQSATVSDTSQSFADLGFTFHADTTHIEMSIENGNLRIRMDGSAATSTTGNLAWGTIRLTAEEAAVAELIRADLDDILINIEEKIIN